VGICEVANHHYGCVHWLRRCQCSGVCRSGGARRWRVFTRENRTVDRGQCAHPARVDCERWSGWTTSFRIFPAASPRAGTTPLGLCSNWLTGLRSVTRHRRHEPAIPACCSSFRAAENIGLTTRVVEHRPAFVGVFSSRKMRCEHARHSSVGNVHPHENTDAGWTLPKKFFRAFLVSCSTA